MATTPHTAQAEAEDKNKAMEAVKKMMEGKGARTAAWVLLVFYLAVATGLLLHFGLGWGTGGNWDHASFVFNALSAIGAAAAGVLLGTKVEQKNVATAQKEAVKAKMGEAAAKRQESETADAATVLSNIAEKVLGKRAGTTFGAESFSILPDSDDEKLRQAIMDMNKVLRQRSSL